MRKSLLTVAERFPDHGDKLQKLFEESESFQLLCDDHMRCAEALRYWQQSASEEAPTRRGEYASLLQDLEAEILRSLLEAK